MEMMDFNDLFSLWSDDKESAEEWMAQKDVIISMNARVDYLETEEWYVLKEFLFSIFIHYKGYTPTTGVNNIRDLIKRLSKSILLPHSFSCNFIPVELLAEYADSIHWDELLQVREIPNEVLIECEESISDHYLFVRAVSLAKPREVDLFINHPGLFCSETFLRSNKLKEDDLRVLSEHYLNGYLVNGPRKLLFARMLLGNSNVGKGFFEEICNTYSIDLDLGIKTKASERYGDDIDFVLRKPEYFNIVSLFSFHRYDHTEIERLYNELPLSLYREKISLLIIIIEHQDFSPDFFDEYMERLTNENGGDEVILDKISKNIVLSDETKSYVRDIISFKNKF